jgi:hypothetical protein
MDRECFKCGEMHDVEIEGGSDRNGNALCGTCLQDAETDCAFCEESFYHPEAPEERFLHIAVGDESDTGTPPGIYRVKEYPFYRASVLGFDAFFQDAIEKMGEARSNRQSGFICKGCYSKYTLLQHP